MPVSDSQSMFATLLRTGGDPAAGWKMIGLQTKPVDSRVLQVLARRSMTSMRERRSDKFDLGLPSMSLDLSPRHRLLLLLAPFLANSGALPALAQTQTPERQDVSSNGWLGKAQPFDSPGDLKTAPRVTLQGEIKGNTIEDPVIGLEGGSNSSTGLVSQDYKVGSGSKPKVGDSVVVQWEGLSIGNEGRYFEIYSDSSQESFFADLIFKVGDGTVIPGIDEAVRGMSPGGIRRIIVPEALGYPKDGFDNIKPKPSTSDGERQLGKVLFSKDLDKTLLFDLKLTKVRPAK